MHNINIKVLFDLKRSDCVKSPIKWVGGKSKLARIILPMFPKHDGYVEVFGGSAYMLFSKEPSKWEVLNDYDSNLMNFWSVIKNAPDQFIDSFNYILVSRETFNIYKQKYKNNDFNDNIEKAHVFYYLVKAGFGMSFPIRQQMNKHDCSVCVIWCILRHAEIDINYLDLYRFISPPTKPDEGISGDQIIKILKKFGIKTISERSNISKLRFYTTKWPVIVSIQHKKKGMLNGNI
jgi:hypothetical protein